MRFLNGTETNDFNIFANLGILKTEIKNLENIENNSTQQLFHAGTIKVDNRILANGGRVLNATTMASNLNEARKKAHSMLDLVDWEDKYFRKDIGWRAIK